MSWFHTWLFLHITAAIIAFGPTFAFPIIGAVSRQNPTHAGFGLMVSEVLELRLVIPFALSMLVSGLGLAYTIGIEWQHNVWLIVAVSVYAAAIFVALGLQAPLLRKLVKMTAHSPAPAVGPGAAAAGPPPAMAAMLKRMQLQGMLLTVFLMTIIVLMVWKPGGNI